ncbi:metallo-beta-lactamase superfamily protein [Aspergillus uvarum CBS 121591]|uniref:Metallo-beta-lactamase superfamily protein n=1 Tax=Aspergillus uvarum CBS 121591 TaxID=1448315 RepID=A0A319DGR2_9EURO|nr:metallo-beta-lactamase superfamily protein [Aspergillus uvarum CBS 121591]PYH87318.1 metallo-beta-lactamase superfamily protein [Aspergillus uvarum CBS 121591]
MSLQVDVYVAPPIRAETGSEDPSKQWWSPISCTLIQGPTSAVLVDTPISVQQSEDLAAWIKTTAPGKNLRYIFTTHAHCDHFFGNPVIRKHFPSVVCVATSRVVQGIERTLATSIPRWTGWFPGGQFQAEEQIIPEALPESGEFSIDGHSLFGVPVKHSDTEASSFLHVPVLRLVVAGDIVYGDCFQFLAEARTAEKRQDWLQALDQIDALKPSIVVPGHKRASQADGPYLIEATRQYILAFEEKVNQLRDADRVEEAMKKRYPQRWNRYLLQVSCASSVSAL